LDHRESLSSERFNYYGIPIFKFSHMKLAGGHPTVGTMRFSIDLQGTCPADPFPAIVIKLYGFLTLLNKLLVKHIHHFQERLVRIHISHWIGYYFSFI